MKTLLKVENLDIAFRTEEAIVHAVRDVSFSVAAGRTLCIVGESGSGKSVTCHALLGLTPRNGRVRAGRILFDGNDLRSLPEADMEKIRGRAISMVFQDPMSSLNPVHTIGQQIVESLKLHRGLTGNPATTEAKSLLDRVGIPEAAQRLREYPHQLSGGMNQRAMIAMALAGQPRLLIADEPTTALDVTIQAQILDLLRDLQSDLGMAIIFVTHDFGVVAEMADDVVVMRRGEVVEGDTAEQLLAHPSHPYTQELLRLVPRLDAPSPVYGNPAREAP
ncbi:ATP-binding cassette domain-containing protein [Pelagibius sp.]|uniref:ATP-binding cassette domain-containing protein n=1 Tax=Pelagibius sp. TaxID=1931238 RepID=UPI003BB1DF41